jgi:hypothetical protein
VRTCLGGILRVGFSHITWSVNSICHRVGEGRFGTRDWRTNVAWLALVSPTTTPTAPFPTSARHGLDRGQCDTSAALIRVFERIGRATHARRRRLLAASATAPVLADLASLSFARRSASAPGGRARVARLFCLRHRSRLAAT